MMYNDLEKEYSSNDLEQEYSSELRTWTLLKEEVDFILRRSVVESGIKIHQIESRIKDFGSFIGKTKSKNLRDPLNQINDVVGFRVITLFRSSLADLHKIFDREFSIISIDDKMQDITSMGYKSIHYICEIKSEYTGPRYDSIIGKKFEIQVRSLCMHAWAAVSYYLDYKGDWDVPEELKISLQALSGLFHAADNQFEQFFRARLSYKQKIEHVEPLSEKEYVNLDTLHSYLLRKFPDRNSIDKNEMSDFVHEMKLIGVEYIDQLDKIINESNTDFQSVEGRRSNRFANLGAARISVAIARQDYRDLKYSGQSKSAIQASASSD